MERSTAPPTPDRRDAETASDAPHTRPPGRGAHPALPVVLAGVWLAVAYTLIVLVDVRGVGRDHLEAVRPSEPAMWLQLFNPNSPTELLAWLLLGLFALGSAHTAGRLQQRATETGGRRQVHAVRRQAAFWRLAGVAGVLMLLEDTANVRYRLDEWAELLGISPGRDYLFVVEGLWYAVIAGVFAVAIVRHGRTILPSRATVGFGVAAIVLYAVAAIGSVTREVFWWYVDLGARIEGAFPGPLPQPPGWNEPTVHFYLSDRVFEESLELLGAACLVGAVLAFRRYVGRQQVGTAAQPSRPDAVANAPR